jgi:hypothetical protein
VKPITELSSKGAGSVGTTSDRAAPLPAVVVTNANSAAMIIFPGIFLL